MISKWNISEISRNTTGRNEFKQQHSLFRCTITPLDLDYDAIEKMMKNLRLEDDIGGTTADFEETKI